MNTNKIKSISKEMDLLYGKVGTPEREQFRNEAYAFCVGQVVQDIRKKERVTQTELARRIGVGKSYISRIEHGNIDPSVSTFYRLVSALGRSVELVPVI